jgi:septal ring factor EnvC (AmiA/AmiB activator)
MGIAHLPTKFRVVLAKQFQRRRFLEIDQFLIFCFEDLTYASSDSRCEIRQLQQSIDTKKLEIQQEIMYQTNLSTNLEKLNKHIKKQTDSIVDSEKELTKINLESTD